VYYFKFKELAIIIGVPPLKNGIVGSPFISFVILPISIYYSIKITIEPPCTKKGLKGTRLDAWTPAPFLIISNYLDIFIKVTLRWEN
jgi:hypothetical protein